jgi:GNAT superfamily N-acetyltransferase
MICDKIFLFIHGVSSGDAYVHAIGPLFVSPDSSDRGVGKALMKSLVEHEHKLNAPSIRLTTVHSIIPHPPLIPHGSHRFVTLFL